MKRKTLKGVEYFKVIDILSLLSDIINELEFESDNKTKKAIKEVVKKHGVFNHE